MSPSALINVPMLHHHRWILACHQRGPERKTTKNSPEITSPSRLTRMTCRRNIALVLYLPVPRVLHSAGNECEVMFVVVRSQCIC